MNFKKNFYQNIVPRLQSELKIKNKLAVPRVSCIKVCVSIGSYLSSTGSKDYSAVVQNITQITGQKPIVNKARKAISNFKLRQGMPVGVTTTLRGDRMVDFLNKLINVVLPRIRDFRGVSKKSFGGKGNYSLGIKEYTVFPEIHPEDLVKNHGLQVTIITTAKNDNAGFLLLKELGMPFKKEN